MRKLLRPLGAGAAASVLVALGPLGMADAGAQSTLLGYNATALGVGAQFGFNVPNVVPLPNENLIEEDIPFARTNLGQGPVVDSVGAAYYPGDVAANIGTLLQTDGFPFPVPNDTVLAESKYPPSPGYSGQASYGVNPATATAAQPSYFYSTATTSATGGAATGFVSNLALNNEGVTTALPVVGASSATSLVDIGNVNASNTVVLGSGNITATANSSVKSIDIAGLVDIAGVTSTASATSDGTTGTPTSSLHVGQVTVNGQPAYIDSTGVHVSSAPSSAGGITPAQLQQTINGTFGQDGITVTIINPTLTSGPGQATANAGGLEISIAHQLDVPFVPGEPNEPLPQLGNQGLPAGQYTVTTNITFGLAQASVTATALSSQISALPTTIPTTTLVPLPVPSSLGNSGNTGNTGAYGSTAGSFSLPTGSTESLGATGGGSTAPATPFAQADTSFPLRGVPAPLGWTVTALLGCFILCYPLLLLARFQFIPRGRRP
jgi:hypothetical protein